MNRFRFAHLCAKTLAGFGLVLMAAGCEKSESKKESAATPAASTGGPTVSNAAAAPDPQVTAILVKADAKDGKTDQIVSKCALCAFRMDGTPDHKVAYAGYTLQFCAPHCRETFEKDPKGQALAFKVDP